jgi:hypothetical protein
MKNFITTFVLITCLSCTKQIDQTATVGSNFANTAIKESKEPIQLSAQRQKPGTSTTFTKYTIQQGAHSCDQSTLKFVSGSSMNFIAKFDNTAIYVLSNSAEATDINKLYGFSEGIDNHQNSARIGWRYLNNRLELFAYVYVNGTLLRDATSYDPPFIKTVEINTEINCSIAVLGAYYIFKVDGVEVRTPRGLTTNTFSGYQQYPYFGGTEVAPQLMNFYIR